MENKVRLTQTVTAAGCAAKLDPGLLSELLQSVEIPTDSNLLVGIEKLDDAGIYKITEDIALVQTVDFFTPIVDDPFLFGQIAAANALSDVYAMGGRPVTAMNMVCFPSTTLDKSILAEIIKGGISKIKEAGAVLAGGHSIMDKEIKYGLSVTGLVHPKRIWANGSARPGDKLILTKPLGCGIMSTAIKQGIITEKGAQEALDSMARLNQSAALVFAKHDISACTDVTGFSLMGHGLEMAEGSDVTLRIHSSTVPLMDGILELVKQDAIPGGAHRNRKYYGPRIAFGRDLSLPQEIFFDPQTSGGLLGAVRSSEADACLDELKKNGNIKAAIIGEVLTKEKTSLQLY